jgi:hypothetical protein
MYSLELLMMDGKTLRNMQCYSEINKCETLVHLVGFTIEIDNTILYRSGSSGNNKYSAEQMHAGPSGRAV